MLRSATAGTGAADLPQALRIEVGSGSSVGGLLQVPAAPRACLVLAHGAGAGMDHPFMVALAGALAGHGVATLRYQFPYRERGSKRPDPPALAHAAVRAAVACAAERLPQVKRYAGGKSFGGRMTSQAQADAALPGVAGLVFVGFPLHPAGRPASDRADHLGGVGLPMLFLQGTRDALAELPRMQALTEQAALRATLVLIAEADHSFHVPRGSGRSDADVIEELAAAAAAWMNAAA